MVGLLLSCRPNKDDGKKNEERTGVKKKGKHSHLNFVAKVYRVSNSQCLNSNVYEAQTNHKQLYKR